MVRRPDFAATAMPTTAAHSAALARESIRCAEITGPGTVTVVDRPAPQGRPAPGHLRVRMLAVGICGTDHSLASGARTPPELPWRLGHEGVGEVVEVGSGTSGWVIGDRVALEPNITCGRCDACATGVTSACAQRLSAGVLTQPGFLAEAVDHPAEFCHQLRAEVPVERAVCAEPLAVAASAIRRTDLHGGEEVLVIGAGAQGLLAILVLVSRGCQPWVSELDPSRLALAVELGARAFDTESDLAVDVVIDAAGVSGALGAVVDHLSPFAKVTIVGETHDRLGASTFDIVQHQLTITGSFIYDHPGDMASAVDLLESLPVERILADPTPIEETPKLFGNGTRAVSSATRGTVDREPGRSRARGIKRWVDLRA